MLTHIIFDFIFMQFAYLCDSFSALIRARSVQTRTHTCALACMRNPFRVSPPRIPHTVEREWRLLRRQPARAEQEAKEGFRFTAKCNAKTKIAGGKEYSGRSSFTYAQRRRRRSCVCVGFGALQLSFHQSKRKRSPQKDSL